MATVKNVHKAQVKLVKLPTPFEEEDRGLRLCGQPIMVLATMASSKRYKNDLTGIALVCDDLTIELEKEDGSVISALGTAVDFPFQSNAKGFVIDWRQHTVGCYKVRVNFDIDGTTGWYYYGAFNRQEWTMARARNTVQMFVTLNDVVRKDGINYRNSGFCNSIRFVGTFGEMQPNYEVENLTYHDRSRKKVRIEARRTYTLTTSYLVNCYTNKIDAEHLLVANNIWITEHNTFNHNQYQHFAVILDESKSPDYNYTDGVYASITATFLDKVAVHESKYDGNIEAKQNVSFDLPSGIDCSGTVAYLINNSDNSYNQTINNDFTLPDEVINIYVNGVLDSTVSVPTLGNNTINITN